LKSLWDFSAFYFTASVSRAAWGCAAVVHDDAGAFPGFNETFAGIGAVELQGEVAHPDGFVVGAVGDGEARANHVQLVLYAW
jgi:hypothetical protein